MDAASKRSKELFVLNTDGCDVKDIIAVIFLIPTLIVLQKAIQSRLRVSLFSEFVTLVAPLLLALTYLSREYIIFIYTAVICSIFFLICVKRTKIEISIPTDAMVERCLVGPNPRLVALSLFKGTVCYSIL